MVASPRCVARYGRVGAAAVTAAVVVLTLKFLPPVEPVAPAIAGNPLVLLAGDILDELRPHRVVHAPPVEEAPPPMYAQLRRPTTGGKKHKVVRDVKPAPPEERQRRSVQFVPPLLATAGAPAKRLPTRADTPWNVVMVIMESTGAGYVFDRVRGKVPMPFLQRLSRRSLMLANHYSTSNTSPHSIFSLLSGLYPMPRPKIFVFRKGLRYPTLFSMVPRTYQSLLVTPGSLSYYYPRDFMAHRGPREQFGREELPGKRMAPGTRLAKDEAETVGFFLRRLDSYGARPFVAVYYSFLAHWPYPVHGPPHDRFPCRQRSRPELSRCRYYNNIGVLDDQIRRIHEHLRRRGLLRRTILVLVGDHGEAFGQHKKNWIHSHHSYNENLRVPAMLYQPRLFKVRRVTQATSHVDLLPTLLDAMRLPYNSKLLQGESLYQTVFSRRYIFAYGKENTLSSISRSKVKLQLSFKTGKCRVYDLARDPHERRRLRCKGHAAQHRALLFYHRYQRAMLKGYNRACRKGLAYHGQRHPKGK